MNTGMNCHGRVCTQNEARKKEGGGRRVGGEGEGKGRAISYDWEA